MNGLTGGPCRVGDVQLGLWFFFEATVAHVADHADDRRPGTVRRGADAHVLPERILVFANSLRAIVSLMTPTGGAVGPSVGRSRGRGGWECPSSGSSCASRAGTALPAARQPAAARFRAGSWSSPTCCRAALASCRRPIQRRAALPCARRSRGRTPGDRRVGQGAWQVHLKRQQPGGDESWSTFVTETKLRSSRTAPVVAPRRAPLRRPRARRGRGGATSRRRCHGSSPAGWPAD